MDVVADGKIATGSDKLGIDFLDTRQKHFVSNVYSSVDEAAGCELKRLYVEEGIISSCKPGCFYCCGQHIQTNIAEAQALGHFIKHEFSRRQIEDLRIRTQQWHEWDEIRIGRRNVTHSDEQPAFSTYQYCPLLVEGQCRAYSMRPLICRTHFVCSNPSACRNISNPESVEDDPKVLATVLVVTNPFLARIRDSIETTGLNFNRSIMLLPQWLAIEMNWDFAISPQFG
jgi:Fe-S-cluster containining protein